MTTKTGTGASPDHSQDTQVLVEETERKKSCEAYLDAPLGLRNHWYAVFFGTELPEDGVRGKMVCTRTKTSGIANA